MNDKQIIIVKNKREEAIELINDYFGFEITTKMGDKKIKNELEKCYDILINCTCNYSNFEALNDIWEILVNKNYSVIIKNQY